MQVNIGEAGGYNRPLRSSPAGVRPVGPLHDAGVEPLDDQPDDPLVPDASLDHPDQMVTVEIVEEPADIGVNDPVDLPPFYSDRDSVERIVRTPPRPEAVAEPEELRLVDRDQNHIRHCPLENLVLQRRNAERSLPSVLLGYVHPPGRRRPVRAPVNAGAEVGQSAFQPVRVHLPRHAVHARRRVLPQGLERVVQDIDRHMVEQRHKTLFRIPPCSLSYAISRL